MSFNTSLSSLIYDPATYREEVQQSTQPLSYMLNPIKFENCHKCRHEIGIVGGNDVSLTTTNIVDLESDLSGRSRILSKATCSSFVPFCRSGKKCKNASPGIPYECPECQEKKYHLRPCQMISYQPRIDNVGYKIEQPSCDDILKKNQSSRMRPNSKMFSKVDGITPYVPSKWQGSTGLAAYN